jgi:hypothetical protein
MDAWSSLTSLLILGVAASPAPARVSPRPPSAASAAAPQPSPAGTASPEGPVILFLVDNSASLPPLDPEEQRVAALEKMFTFLKGQPYRLILFGGRSEVFVDDVSKYHSDGQWTDFYFAFLRARDLMREYPPGTAFRMVLLTDAIVDPGPSDWLDQGLPPGVDVKIYSSARTLALIQEMAVPLYVILVGKAALEGGARNPEQAPGLVLEMVQAANGLKASPLAQSLAAFFSDDGALLKKFVYRVAPTEGLKKLEPIVTRVAAPAQATVEAQFLSVLILPLGLFVVLLLGVLVRSFPGPGDVETVELLRNQPVHLSVNRLHRLESGGWADTGLGLLPDAKDAAATLTYQASALDLSGKGLSMEDLDPVTLKLLPLAPDELRRALDDLAEHGTKDEKIYVLNLDYVAKNFDPAEAERLLAAPVAERKRLLALDFLRAKVHLLSNEGLRKSLTEPRAHFVSYGKDAERKELQAGSLVRIGPYRFLVQSVLPGGRKDARIVLHYDRVPSLLGLKVWLPDRFQQVFRFRRSSHRVVS